MLILLIIIILLLLYVQKSVCLRLKISIFTDFVDYTVGTNFARISPYSTVLYRISPYSCLRKKMAEAMQEDGSRGKIRDTQGTAEAKPGKILA